MAHERSSFVTLSHNSFSYKVHYWYHKNPDSDLVFVFHHGLLSGVHSLYAAIDILALYGSVITFDRPAFGLSERILPSDPTWSQCVVEKSSSWPVNPLNSSSASVFCNSEQLSEMTDKSVEWVNPYSAEFGSHLCKLLLEHLLGAHRKDWGTVVLIGHSLGGNVAVVNVLRYPGMFDGLILLNAAVHTSIPCSLLSSWVFSAVGKMVVRHIIPKTTPGQMAYVNPLNKVLSPQQIELYRQGFTQERWEDGLFEFGKHQLALKINPTEMLSLIPTPVLVITGDSDAVIPMKETMKIFNDLNLRGHCITKMVTIPSCGHCPFEEKPGVAISEIMEFLSEVTLSPLTPAPMEILLPSHEPSVVVTA